MGSSSSKVLVTDPTTFATPVEIIEQAIHAESKDLKSYDYVIIGGGM